jgi:site-specific DNA-methyltransferase (adenine-specific)
MNFLKGDCLEVMKTIPNKSIDLIICDLPYGCLTNKQHADGTEGKSKGGKKYTATTGCAWDIKIDLEAFWKEVRRIRKDDHTPTIHFCTTKFGYELIKSNEKEFRYDLVWDKQRGVSFLSANKMPMRSHEMIYVFSKAGAFYERKDIVGEFKSGGGGGLVGGSIYDCSNSSRKNKIERVAARPDKRCILSVIQQTSSLKKGQHPTEKPSDLYRFLIERYSKEGDTILDPTAGSFNSCFVAHEMKRRAIGIEKDTKFFWKAISKSINSVPLQI